MEYITEGVATFFFVSVVMMTNEPVAIGVALIAAIYFANKLSRGSINPAISVALWMKGDLNTTKTLSYIAAEMIGGVAAYMWFSKSRATANSGGIM